MSDLDDLTCSMVLGPAEVTSRAGDKDADIDHKGRLRCVDRARDDPNSHRTVATASGFPIKFFASYFRFGVLTQLLILL